MNMAELDKQIARIEDLQMISLSLMALTMFQ